MKYFVKQSILPEVNVSDSATPEPSRPVNNEERAVIISPVPAPGTAAMPVFDLSATTVPSAKPTVKHAALTLFTALGIGVAADALWLNAGATGIGFTLLMTLVPASLLVLALREKTPIKWRNVVMLAAPLLYFAAMATIRENSTLTFWNVVACLGLLTLLCGYLAAGRVEGAGFGELWQMPWVAALGLARPAPLVADVVNQTAKTGTGRAKALPFLRGVLLATPVLVVFLALLGSADAVFGKMLSNIGALILPRHIEDWVGHIVTALIIFWLVAGAFVYALTRRDVSHETASAKPGLRVGFTEGMTVLGSVCAVFGLFVAVQFAYLFGGHVRVQTVPRLTYAEYAHKGFGELVTVAFLTFLLLNGLRVGTRRDGTGQVWTFRAFGTLLVGFTLVLLASAYTRMAAYEAAYGATETRLHVDVFLFWLGGALLYLTATLWAEGVRLAPGVLACMVGGLTTLNALNPDAQVARVNLARYASGKSFDAYTMQYLSYDAVPALVAAYDAAPEGNRKRLLSGILQQYWMQASNTTRHGWPTYHRSRARALALLEARAAQLPGFEAADWYRAHDGNFMPAKYGPDTPTSAKPKR